jgi:hypothetical protein
LQKVQNILKIGFGLNLFSKQVFDHEGSSLQDPFAEAQFRNGAKLV